MYAPDTVLELKEKRSTDDKTFPYDEVRVIGPSPVSHASIESEWSGQGTAGVILEPLSDFGANIDEPLGKVQSLYNVKSEPEITVPVPQTITRVNQTDASAGPSPEEVFAKEAPGKPVEKPKRRKSPLNA